MSGAAPGLWQQVEGLGLLIFPLWYAATMLKFRAAWLGLPRLPEPEEASPPLASTPVLCLSVLIAARNEAENLPALLHDLNQQMLPAAQYEVIVADDHSTDTTAAVVRLWQSQVAYTLRLLSLAELPGAPTGKKAAMEAAVAVARAPWVVCTDADCRVSQGWLSAHAAWAATPEVHFVSGPVLLTGGGALAQLQGLELAGLVGAGAAGIGLKAPTMCNGANLSYRKATFAAVHGFAGNDHLASGDDEFLLHKMHAAYPAGIRFLREPPAIVRTAAQPTLGALLNQRVRWASKWRHYQQKASQRLAVLVLLANVALVAGAGVAVFCPRLGPWVLAAWLVKLGADAWFLGPVLSFLARRRWLAWVVILQLLYAPYALLIGLLGLRGSYTWKQRSL